MRVLLHAMIVSSVVLASVPALAADADAGGLGADGQFLLSAERLFGVTHTTFKDEDSTLRAFRVNVFGAGSPDIGTSVPSPAAIPRLAADWVVGSHVTVGVAAGVSYANFSDADGDGITHFGFLASPRVGYLVPIGGGSQFWLRGGVTYFRANNAPDNGSSRTWNHVTATFEPTFVVPIGGNVSFTVAPVAELPLSGKYSSSSRSEKLTALSLGANCGLLAHF